MGYNVHYMATSDWRLSPVQRSFIIIRLSLDCQRLLNDASNFTADLPSKYGRSLMIKLNIFYLCACVRALGCVNLHANKQQILGILIPDTGASLIGPLRRSKLPTQQAFDLWCWLYLGIRPNDVLCRSCVLSLHRKWAVLDNTHNSVYL